MAGEQGVETLQAWQRSVALVKLIYDKVLPTLPGEEKWAMGSQLRRAVQSIASNIAEGYGRFYYQEGVRVCYIARGSAEEVFTYITLAKELDYISGDLYAELRTEILELQCLINGYINFLKRSKRGDQEVGSDKRLRENRSVYGSIPDLEIPNT